MNERSRIRGQAMVEFGIIVFVLLLLILGTLQFAFIYHAKIQLNYAAFETARAGALNNARMWAMELAFARAMAPLYTTPYLDADCNGISYAFDPGPEPVGGVERPTDLSFELEHVECARQRVRDMIADGLVRITLVNPGPASFSDHGYLGADGAEVIPNDNLMYRSAVVRADSGQSVQDANLIKIHVGFCYELIVPLVDRMIARMISDPPSELQPENFGAPIENSFAATCVAATETDGAPREGIPLYAQAVMRMQSDPIRDTFCGGDCPDGGAP